jgi:hypothetical protein
MTACVDTKHRKSSHGRGRGAGPTMGRAQNGVPLDMLRRMKFEPIGFGPIENRPLNLVEQINQTWTCAVAIAAARQLLSLPPNVGGLRLAPGAHASLELDIMSEQPGAVGAETLLP